jgi:hypothetical protein
MMCAEATSCTGNPVRSPQTLRYAGEGFRTKKTFSPAAENSVNEGHGFSRAVQSHTLRALAPEVRISQTDASCLFSAESFSFRSTRSAMSATSRATLATAALPSERYR